MFVMASAVIMAGSALAMVFTRTLAGCLGVAVIFGIGFGTFIAVDFGPLVKAIGKERERESQWSRRLGEREIRWLRRLGERETNRDPLVQAFGRERERERRGVYQVTRKY